MLGGRPARRPLTRLLARAQLFYVSCVVLYFRRLKKMEREIQPPEVYKCP